jgi:outer membrane receptor protein involved in Fe transport
MTRFRFLQAAVCMVVLMPSGRLIAQQNAAGDLPLDTLLNTPIKTAAKYDQTLSSVAASVTVITSEEIERYGWTSLPDLLQSIPGFYVTYDRNYWYIGVRGVGRPTDYNSRIMVLRNGIALNGDVFGGAQMPEIDPAAIERIEIVRGPGSALYGSHAMLAVVNIISKSADAIDGVGASLTYGSNGREGATVRMGKTLSNGLRVTASGYLQRSRGADLYFLDFDSPATNNGISSHLDYEEMHNFQFQVERGKFRLTALIDARNKGIPTASYGTVFNVDSNTTDKQNLLVAEYEVPLGVGKSVELSGRYENARTRGYYPYGSIGVDDSLSIRYGAEARFHWDIRPNHRLTAGIEVSRSARGDYNYVVGDYQIHLMRPYTRSSLYVQDEFHPSAKLGIVAGVRYDNYPFTKTSMSPRAAILYTPTRSTTIKLLYGTAFRTPTVYESEFEDPLTPWKENDDLKAETIRTSELVLEQRVSPEWFFVGSLFHVNATDLINQQIDSSDEVGWYRNVGSLKSTGAEMSLELRKGNGLWAHLGFSAQRATDDDGQISNSPSTLIRAGISTPPRLLWHGGLEAIYDSLRLTRDDATTPSFLLVNSTVTRRLGAGVRVGVTIRNLFNKRYATPVGPELVPQSIVQDGRTLALVFSFSR